MIRDFKRRPPAGHQRDRQRTRAEGGRSRSKVQIIACLRVNGPPTDLAGPQPSTPQNCGGQAIRTAKPFLRRQGVDVDLQPAQVQGLRARRLRAIHHKQRVPRRSAPKRCYEFVQVHDVAGDPIDVAQHHKPG